MGASKRNFGVFLTGVLAFGLLVSGAPSAHATLANMTVKFLDVNGEPIMLGDASWRSNDGLTSSSQAKPVSGNGLVSFRYTNVGVGSISIARGFLADGSSVNATWLNVDLGKSGTTELRLVRQPQAVRYEARVRFPDGNPVLGAKVSQTGVYAIQALCDSDVLAFFGYNAIYGGEVLRSCPGVHSPDGVIETNENGVAIVEGYKISPQVTAAATYSDSELTQTSPTIVLGSSLTSTLTLDYMPTISVPENPLTTSENSLVDIPVVVTEPVQSIRGFVSSSGTTRGSTVAAVGVKVSAKLPDGNYSKKCGSKSTTLTAITNSSGKANLKVCARLTGNILISGKGAVSSKPVKLRIKNSEPSPVRNISATVANVRNVRLTWLAPEYAGGTNVTEYLVKAYSGRTIKSFTVKSGTAQFNSRTLVLTGLTGDARWDFTIQARTKYGFGPTAGADRFVVVPK